MRRVPLAPPPPSMRNSVEGRYILGMLDALSKASFENDPAVIASDFVITDFVETRTFDAATATTTDIANVLATLISDLARGGAKKG